MCVCREALCDRQEDKRDHCKLNYYVVLFFYISHLMSPDVYVGEQYQGAVERQVYGVESNSTLLECTPRSLQARVMWYIQRDPDREEVRHTQTSLSSPIPCFPTSF